MPESVIGGNNPPTDAEILRDKLLEKYADLIRRKDDLVKAAEAVPEVCDSPAMEKRMTDFIAKLNACAKSGTDSHKLEKDPFLTGGRVVDSVLKSGVEGAMSDLAKKVNDRVTAYKRKVLEDQRRAQEEERQRQEAEAARLAKEAEEAASALVDEDDLDTALAAEQTARAAQAAATAAAEPVRAAELTRTRTDLGVVSSLTTKLEGKILDIRQIDFSLISMHLRVGDIEFAIRQYKTAHRLEIEAEIAQKPPLQRLAGVEFYYDYSNRTR